MTIPEPFTDVYDCGCDGDLWCDDCARAVQPEGEFGDEEVELPDPFCPFAADGVCPGGCEPGKPHERACIGGDELVRP